MNDFNRKRGVPGKEVLIKLFEGDPQGQPDR